MKTLLFLSAVILAKPAFAEKVCWDGSFGYNYARAVVTGKGLEISFQGSTLGLPPLATDSGQSLVFNGFTGRDPQFHLVIPKSAVKDNGGTITAAISGTAADVFDGRIPALWVAHGVPDLGSVVDVLSPVPLLGVKARVTDKAIEVKFTQMWAYTETDNLTTTVTVDCSYPQAPDELRVPARLKEFLSQPSR